MKHRKTKTILIILVSILLLTTVVGCIYINDYYRANQTALSMLGSDENVTVRVTDDQVVFIPDEPTVGFIFYPGGKEEHTAYSPLLRSLAEQGILCILVEMPFRLAVLDMNAAMGIPAQYAEIDDWYIGGHSLGGSMAASHAAENDDMYDGLVLLASYSTADISESGMDVISVYGTEDHVMNPEKYENYFGNLPESTKEVIIEGGCHAYFGSYGPQEGDGVPTITVEEQTQETVDLLVEFFPIK